MVATFEKLRISAVSVDDNIFRHSTKKKEKTVQPKPDKESVRENAPQESSQVSFEGFDKNAIKIYKKIPLDQECEIESLIDDEHSLRVVMNSLLKLEIGKFVTMLPGERVRRNF